MKKTTPNSTATRIYDVYNKGIHNAILTIEKHDGNNLYTIKKRDIKSNNWSTPVTVPEDKLSDNEDFYLWGGIKTLPFKLKQIEETSWGLNKAVGWPDENSIYVRHKTMTELIGNEKVTAYFWALKDGTAVRENKAMAGPMDIIVSSDNKLIAGADLPIDIWMVLRGYEKFSTVNRWSESGISPALYGCRLLGNFMIPMPDDIKLSTLVYLPEDGKTDGK